MCFYMENVMSKIRCLKKVFLMVAAGFLVAGCSNLSGAGNENLNQNPQKGGTKVFTVSGTIGFNGAVPSEIKEKFFDDTNQNDGTSKAAYASVPTEDITIKVWAENENPEISKLDAVISANKKTFTISLTEGNWKFFGQFFDGDGNLIMTYSDKNFVPINEDNESYSPIIKLAPSKTGTGYVKLAFNVSDGLYDKVSCKFNGNEYSRENVSAGELYFNGTGFSADYTQTGVAAGSYETVFYFWKNDVIAYQILQTINVYNNMTTDSWIGNEKYFKSGKIELDEEMLKKFVLTNIYVGSGSGKGNGTYYEPYTDLKYAFDSIKANAKMVAESGSNNYGEWNASEFHIWVKDTFIQKENINISYYLSDTDFDNFILTTNISSCDDTKKTIDCSGCSTEFDFLKITSDVLDIYVNNIEFYNCRKGIYIDSYIELNNCSFTGNDTTIQEYAVKLAYNDITDGTGGMAFLGETYFEENYPIYMENYSSIYLYSSFAFTNRDLFANIKVAQGTPSEPYAYGTQSTDVPVDSYLIQCDYEVEDQFKAAGSKFKICNYWYGLEYVEGEYCYKTVPCFNVAPTVTTDGSPCGSASGNGSEYSPLDINTAIKMYNYFVGDVSGAEINYYNFTTTISFAEGVYDAPELSKCGDCIKEKYNLILKGKGRRDSTSGTGTLIKTEFTDRPFIKRGDDESVIYSLTLKDLSVKYTALQPNSDYGFLSVTDCDLDFNNVELSGFKMNEEDSVVINSQKNFTLKDVYIHDCERTTSSNSCNGCAIYYEGTAYGTVLEFENVTIQNCKIVSNGNFDDYNLNGAAVYFAGKVFVLKGKNIIDNNKIEYKDVSAFSNVYLEEADDGSSKRFSFNSALTGSKIGVTTEVTPVIGNPVCFTAGYDDHNKNESGDLIEPSEYFFSDVNGYGVAEGSGYDEGEACLISSGGKVTVQDDRKPMFISMTTTVYVNQDGKTLLYPVKKATAFNFNVKESVNGYSYSREASSLDVSLFYEGKKLENTDNIYFETTYLQYNKTYTLNLKDTLPVKNYTIDIEYVYGGIKYNDCFTLKPNVAKNRTSLSGTSSKTISYSIYDVEDLIRLQGLNIQYTEITLENDIELIHDWGPINQFYYSTFEGNGHKITGLNVNGAFIESARGSASNIAKIKNLSLYGKAKQAGFVKTCSTCVQLLNCDNYVDITNSENIYAGGLVANSNGDNNVFYNCRNFGNINVNGISNGYVCGIAGGNAGAYFINCENYGDVFSQLSSCYSMGIGRSYNSRIINCVNYGNVKAHSYSYGISDDYVKLCINFGVVSYIVASGSKILVTSNENSEHNYCLNLPYNEDASDYSAATTTYFDNTTLEIDHILTELNGFINADNKLSSGAKYRVNNYKPNTWCIVEGRLVPRGLQE